jgi:cytochrome c-type biogenesis protein CcmH/NrfG
MAHADLAISLAYQAHPDAIDSAEHALRLSPRDRHVASHASLALTIVHFNAERYPECVNWARNTIDERPVHLAWHVYLVAALAMQGNLAAAAEAHDTLVRLRPEFSLTWAAENLPPTGELKERLREGWRRAGVSHG